MIFKVDYTGEKRLDSRDHCTVLDKGMNALVDARACYKPVEKLWFRGVRSSKFRHVYGQPAKREACYDNVNITKNAHDSHFCDVNPKFIAIVTEVAGGGAFIVLPIDRTGRVDFNAYRVTGHTGPVLDVKWNPFNDNIIASCSDDCTVKLWYIPDGGLNNHLRDWVADLHGHKRRVGYIEWHPTAENILASSGFDYLVIVWNVDRGEAINVINCHQDVIYSISFNRDGSRLATTSKDKKLRIIDPRTGVVTAEGVCHNGGRCSKVVYLKGGKLATVGFSRHSDRQLSIWNEQSLSAPLATDIIDSSSGVIFPYYDYDTNILFLAGKGDGNIRYYEIVDSVPWVHFLNQFLSGLPQRSLGFMPKRGCDVSICEIFRFYKLHTTKPIVEPVSMIVPRKSDQFQDDLYPDTASPTPAVSASDWINGINRPPHLMSMRTGIQVQKTYKQKTISNDLIRTTTADSHFQVKLEFLKRATVPDYRPIEQREVPTVPDVVQNTMSKHMNQAEVMTVAENEKNKIAIKPPSKIQQIQKKFEKSAEVDTKTFKIAENNIDDYTKTDNQLQCTSCKKLCDEINKLRKQLDDKDRCIKDLELFVKKLKGTN